MAQQVVFFYKNKADFSNVAVTATASQGSEYAYRALNRSNLNAWITTGSVDADLTTYDIDFGEQRLLTDLILVKHNFKNFIVKYTNDDGETWEDFPTPIAVTNNTDPTSAFNFTQVNVQKFRVTIQNTMEADADKYMFQIIATQRIGQLEAWAHIRGAKHDRNKQSSKTLSGKTNFNTNLGGFSCTLTAAIWKYQTDLDLIQTLFDSPDGFLVWLCGGDESQFAPLVKGLRKEDMYLMQCANDFSPEFYKGIYSAGLANFKLDLVEVID